MIVDAFEVMAQVMMQVDETLQENQNQNGGADEICGLRKFQRNNMPKKL